VSKTRLKKDIIQRFFRDTRNVDIIAFDRDLNKTSDLLPMQYSGWNVNEKSDFGNAIGRNKKTNKSPG